MIEKIENLDTLKHRLESAYDSYSQDGDFTLVDYWKSYLDRFPDQVDFCVNVLLNKEKEKQYGVLQPSKMHRSNSELFLRDSVKNLTVKILLHVIGNEEDKEYFEARKRNVDAIQAKLTELCLSHDNFSDDELSAPKKIRDKASRGKIEALKTFLATLPDPILQSKRLPMILKHLSKIDLTNINWLDKIFILISMSNRRNYETQQELLQEKEQPVERFLQPNEASKRNIIFLLEFLLEYQKLQRRYPEKGDAEARFARFFLWHCKNDGLDAVAAGERYRSFLHENNVYAAFTGYHNVATQFPLIKTGMHSAPLHAKTEDSSTVIDHQTMSFGEDMTQPEKHALLQKLDVTCCFANKDGFKVKTTGTHQAFFVTRHNAQLFISKFDRPIDSIAYDEVSMDREIFVILVSGNTPVSAAEMKALLAKNPLPTETLSTQLAQEISTGNGKYPIAISILPIDRNSKKLQYTVHIPGDDETLAQAFQERLEAQTDFDRYKKLKEEVEEITQRTAAYLQKLDEEIEEAKEDFMSDFRTPIDSIREPDKLILDAEIISANIDQNAPQEARDQFNPIREKIELRYEVWKLSEALKRKDKTPLEKLKGLSENLFGNPVNDMIGTFVDLNNQNHDAPPPAVEIPKPLSLAKKIENTATGYDYLKATLRTLAAFSIVLTIPTIAYCVSTHRWPWQTEGKGLLRQTKETLANFQTRPQR